MNGEDMPKRLSIADLIARVEIPKFRKPSAAEMIGLYKSHVFSVMLAPQEGYMIQCIMAERMATLRSDGVDISQIGREPIPDDIILGSIRRAHQAHRHHEVEREVSPKEIQDIWKQA